MSRYDLIMGRDPKKSRAGALEFGFNDDPGIKGGSKYRGAFRLSKGESARVGIVITELKSMFKAYKVHYHDSGPFLCKSTPGHKSLCCSLSYKGSRPSLRIATIVYVPSRIQEFQDNDTTVLPWVFGKSTFDRLKELHQHKDLDKNDFIVVDEAGDRRYLSKTCPYRFQQVDTTNNSLSWVNHPQKDVILQKASIILRDIQRYVAEDLDHHGIRDRVEETHQSVERAPIYQVGVDYGRPQPSPNPHWGQSITQALPRRRPRSSGSDQPIITPGAIRNPSQSWGMDPTELDSLGRLWGSNDDF